MNQDKYISVRKKKYNNNNNNNNNSQKINSNKNDKEDDNNPKITSYNNNTKANETKNNNNKGISRNRNTYTVFSDSKRKNNYTLYNNKTFKTNKYPIKLEGKNIKDLDIDDNDDLWKQYNNNKNNNAPTKTSHKRHKNNSQILMSNYSINNYITNSYHSNIDSSIVSNNNNVILIDNDKSTYTERLDPKNAIKINKIKDDYIDFLQKQYEDHSKKNFSLDSNNKELLKKCDELIQDNIILNKTLNEYNEKLNTTMQENIYIKSQLDKQIMNNKKNEQKLLYYEEQCNLFKSNNDNYQKIIEELKQQNYQLNANLSNIKDIHKEEDKKLEENYKKQIEEVKKNMEVTINEKIEINNQKDIKIKDLMEEIKILKDKNNELIEELQNKENIIELMYKDNEKLSNQNKLNNIEIEQNAKQLENLNVLIQHKENLINSLKTKEEENEKIIKLNKSNSPSSPKLENSDYINITKLINDNEENKAKIDFLNDKLQTIQQIEKKYNELMDKKTISSTDKSSFVYHSTINSNSKIGRNPERNMNLSKNIKPYGHKSFFKNSALKENQLNTYKMNLNTSRQKYGDNNNNNTNTNTIGVYYLKKEPIEFSTITVEYNNDTIRSSSMKMKEIKTRTINEYNEKTDKKGTYKSIRVNKNNSISEIDKNIKEAYKDKKENSSESSNNKVVSFRRRNYYRRYEHKNQLLLEKDNEEKQEKKYILGKELSEEKDNNKDNNKELLQKMNKNITVNIFSKKIVEEKNNKEMLNEKVKNIENKKLKNSISYYLYGIDRNDFLHIFDITNKRWVEKKKIFEIKPEDKSNTFKKDYQYEGTLLYNMLEGVYILTGENIDILYYFNSKTNTISKICKLNNCHDNGSIMYDPKSNCLFFFGGKHTTSCEYYCLSDKKIYKLPELNSDRANASYIISNNKIFAFFGFSYENEKYVNTIEYIDYIKKDKWVVLNNIKLLNNNISFDIESVSTMYYRQDNNKILLYAGIQGEDEEFITEYYLLYDVKKNSINKIKKWKVNQYKISDNIWNEYTLTKNDPKGFHFAKNSRFILLPKNYVSEGYNKNDIINILIDYKNNVHYILQDKEIIDIYRGEL